MRAAATGGQRASNPLELESLSPAVFEPPGGCLKVPGPLREQQALLTAEPSLQLSVLLILLYNIVINKVHAQKL